jgi:probable rRNA maturation factor
MLETGGQHVYAPSCRVFGSSVMPVYVTRKAPTSIAIRSSKVRSIAEKMLKHIARSEDELSVLLTDDAFIQTLNATHRGKDRPTDVLAFPLDETPDTEPTAVGSPERLLGDVVISLDTAERQAKARKHSLLDEVSFLLAHGILHLVGYDHETDEEEAEMNALTAELVSAAG